ncbi:uncharacterized protein CEXT_566711 [Caerostris extrusa]|uniref:Uncharacterized protein n=1 Tax=Caerostris extrusa TaxID=172846 RepID=A0AAV4VTS2_CAEEX|nr:uncharacterized protein CEXT_566711 [Caerostris extrusa]
MWNCLPSPYATSMKFDPLLIAINIRSTAEPDSDPDFCVHFAEYCNLVNNTKSDKAFFRHLARYEQQVLGHQYHNLVSTCTIETDDEEYNCSSSAVLVPALSFSYEIPFNCFMIYSFPSQAARWKARCCPQIHLGLNLRGVRISPLPLVEGCPAEHPLPYHVPSPVSEGLFLNLGTLYRIYVRVAEKNLLPRPYKSRCTDYEKQWKENGGMGPVTEKVKNLII